MCIRDRVSGVERPIVQRGFIPVPNGPGLGISLVDEVTRQHVRGPYFEPTTEWDKERSWDRLWS